MGADLPSMRLFRLRNPAAQDGFTLIEVLLAATVVLAGLIGSFLMLEVTERTSRTTAAREGATNLARQITEDTRAIPYAQITSSGLVSQLQAMPGLANQATSGTAWQITRRGFTYTITVSESDLPVSSQSVAQKQVSVNVAWTAANFTHSINQVVTVSSAGQGVGLKASALQWANPPSTGWSGGATQPTITSAAITSLTFSVQTPPNASGIVWTVNGSQQSWNATVTSTTSTAWTWTVSSSSAWTIGSLPDGSYTIGAAALNGAYNGPTTTITVKLMRTVPSAPTFAAAGFDTNLYVNGSPATVAELDWTGSNSGEIQVVGYRLINPAGTVICQTTLNSQMNSLSYPANCGMNGASVWCQTPTDCIDFNPPSVSASNTTYSVAALYYDANNALQAAPSTSIAVKGTAVPKEPLAPTTQNTSTNCPSGSHDVAYPYTAGSTDTTSTATSWIFCSAAYSSAATLSGGGSATLYLTSSSGGGCSLVGYLTVDASGSVPYLISSSLSVPAGISTPTAYTLTWTGSLSVAAGDRLDPYFAVSSCSRGSTVTLHYGGSSYPSYVMLPQPQTSAQSAPDPPTGLTLTSNSDGSVTLNWTAPASGPAVTAYRVYRGGQNYTNRLYSDSASSLCDSSGNCSWTDSNHSATTSYYVTAVGTGSAGSNEAESTQTGPVSG